VCSYLFGSHKINKKKKEIVSFENKREFNAFFQAFSSCFFVAHVLWSSKKCYRPSLGTPIVMKIGREKQEMGNIWISGHI
jgi:hypothetical protein